MNKPPAASVDQHDSGFHLPQRLLIDDAIGLGCQRRMQRDDVALSQKRSHFHVLDVILGGPTQIWIRGESKDAHPNTAQNFANALPALSRSVGAGSFALETKPGLSAKLEIKFPY